jgi:hypothetical protein
MQFIICARSKLDTVQLFHECLLFLQFLKKSFSVMLLIILVTPTAGAATTDWIKLLADGNEQAAAQKLLEEAEQLRVPVTIQETIYLNHPSGPFAGVTFYDPTYVNLLKDTAKSIQKSCNCDDDAKITVFRGFRPGISDVNIGTVERPLIPSKGLARKNKLNHGLFGDDNLSLSRQMRRHGANTNGDQIFISSSFDPEIAGKSMHVMVLRMCPNRLKLNTSSGYGDEREILIPLFIHPNELVAIVEHEHGDNLTSGKFKLLSQSGYLSQKSGPEAHEEIRRLSQQNSRALRGKNKPQFENYFLGLQDRKFGQMRTCQVRGCNKAASKICVD